jgi:HJR/Mrr/RecB family endonuclease
MVDRRVPGATPGRMALGFFRERELAELLRWWESGAQNPVVVYGSFGSGKTSVLEVLRNEVEERVADSRAVRRLAWLAMLAPEDAQQLIGPLPRRGRALVVLDDVDVAASPAAVIRTVQALQGGAANVAIALASRHRQWPDAWEVVELGDLTRAEALRLLVEYPDPVSGHRVDIYEAVLNELTPTELSPAVLSALAHRARAMSAEDAISLLREEQHFTPVYPSPTLYPSPDLYPGGSSPAARELNVRVSAVNDELIRRLATQPDLLYELTARKFEELMAELFEREGFEVTLTKQTRDGGYDLYLVKHTAAGALLTLADVKRYRADRKVGVGLVRELYGVVQAENASAGLLATTSFFTPDARQLQEKLRFRMELKDYFDLSLLLRGAQRR